MTSKRAIQDIVRTNVYETSPSGVSFPRTNVYEKSLPAAIAQGVSFPHTHVYEKSPPAAIAQGVSFPRTMYANHFSVHNGILQYTVVFCSTQ